MKRLFSLTVALALFVLLAPPLVKAQSTTQPRILVNGTALPLPPDQQPLIEQGVTLVPMRAIFEALGAAVGWDAATNTVTGTKGSTVVSLTLGAPQATVDGQPVPLTQPARLIGSRTYVPLRFVSESLGARVGWDGETATIRITDKKPAIGGTASLTVTGFRTSLLDYTPGTPDRLIRAIYGDGLLRHRPENLQVEPALAVDMPTVSDDGLTYTFRLRKGITFHDGTEVTAKDFILSMDLASSWGLGWPLNGGVFGTVISLSAPDPYTLVLRTKEPLAHRVTALATIPPLPSHLIGRVPIAQLATHAFWDAPIGAGAFRIASHSASALILERYPQFWEAAINPEVGPWLERLHFRIATSDSARIGLLQRGALDVLDQAQPVGIEGLKTIPSLEAYEYGRLGLGYFYFNMEAYPTNMLQVRQALSLAFDRQQAVDLLLAGQATVPSSPLPAFHWAADPQAGPQTPDMARAIALLEAAGFVRNAAGLFEKDGQVLTITLCISRGSPMLEGLGQLARHGWAQIGVRTELLLLDYNVLTDDYLTSGRYNATVTGFSFGPDLTGYFDGVWTTDAMKASGFNRGRYSNPAFDALVARMKRTADPNERGALFRQAAAVLEADAPAIWVYSNRFTDFVKDRIQGVKVREGYGVSHPEYWYVTEQN